MLAGDALGAQCHSPRQLCIEQVLMLMSPMLTRWCRHCFPPPRLGDRAGTQLSPAVEGWGCAPQGGSTTLYSSDGFPSGARNPQQSKPERPARCSSWQECIQWFSFNFFMSDCHSSPKLTFCLQQVAAGSGILLAWECYSYKLSGFFHTSDGVDSICVGNSFHLVTNI